MYIKKTLQSVQRLKRSIAAQEAYIAERNDYSERTGSSQNNGMEDLLSMTSLQLLVSSTEAMCKEKVAAHAQEKGRKVTSDRKGESSKFML